MCGDSRLASGCIGDVQIVTAVPTKKLVPKGWKFGSATEEEIRQQGAEDEDERGQILWLRGLTRLQQQVRTPSPHR